MINNHINCILFFIFFVTLTGCGGKELNLSEKEIALSEQLKEKFSNQSVLIYNTDTLLASKEVLAYYKTNSFAPLWSTTKKLTPNGDSLYALIQNSYDYGFVPEMFHSDLIESMKDSSLLDTEMLLANAFFLYNTHINVGCIDTITNTYVWKKDSIDFSIESELDRVRDGASPNEIILSHQPQFWDYVQLQKGLVAFLDSFDLDTNHYEIPAFKEDSVLCYEVANKALVGHYFLDSLDQKNDSIFIDRLKKFQRVNGLLDDAIVGKWTGRALAKSNRDRFLQAALSLEKWRWKKPFPAQYIRVNIPEYSLIYVDSNVIKRKHKVVVGAYKTQTPEFHATMRRMVTNPFWHVPFSISSTEILYNAKRDTSYLRKKGYRVFKSGNEIDPTTVDWSSIRQNSFPYRIRQDGGGGNSLGKVKFLFPNLHSVFIHDTPAKRFFSNDIRAYSHGCVRLQEPFDLAKAILYSEVHEIESDTLDSIIARGIQRVIELKLI